MYVVAMANQKGGVGKTTTAANVANAAALRGLSVLLVDLDPQGSATRLTDATPREAKGALGNAVQLTVSDALYATQAREGTEQSLGMIYRVTVPAGQYWSERLSIAPANQDLAQRGGETFQGSATRLAASLQAAAGESEPDLVVIDCPPTLGTLFAAALHAADGALVITQAADGSVEGIGRTQAAIAQVRHERGASKPELLGVVVCDVPVRERRASELLEHLRAEYGDLLWDVVPHRSVVTQAEGAGAPLSAYTSPRDGAEPVQLAYERITDRLLSQIPARPREGAR